MLVYEHNVSQITAKVLHIREENSHIKSRRLLQSAALKWFTPVCFSMVNRIVAPLIEAEDMADIGCNVIRGGSGTRLLGRRRQDCLNMYAALFSFEADREACQR